MRAFVDDSRWPLSVQTLASDMSEAEYDGFLEQMRRTWNGESATPLCSIWRRSL